MGLPAVFVALMRLLMPGWSKMAGRAHTLPYDLSVLAGTPAGRPLPARRWDSAVAPTLVMVGGKSEAFFARRCGIEGCRHLTLFLKEQVMKYICLGYMEEKKWDTMTQSE